MYKLTSKILLYNDTDLLALFDTHDEDMIYNSIISQDILIQVVYPLILWYIMNNIVYKAESANIACVIKLVEAPVNPTLKDQDLHYSFFVTVHSHLVNLCILTFFFLTC